MTPARPSHKMRRNALRAKAVSPWSKGPHINSPKNRALWEASDEARKS